MQRVSDPTRSWAGIAVLALLVGFVERQAIAGGETAAGGAPSDEVGVPEQSAGGDAGASLAVQSIEIVGTQFKITLSNGHVLSNEELLGAVLWVGDPEGGSMPVRIDNYEIDPKDPEGEIVLYELSTYDPSSGAWRLLCEPDPDGRRLGFPLAGTWTGEAEHLPGGEGFSLTCTSGAMGKCVRFGYKPWKTAPDGTPMWRYHQACTRMVRADYCGDGEGHTRAGTPIVLYDPLGIQEDEPLAGASFEAGWGQSGAVCVRHVRIPELLSLDELVRTCPELKGRVGKSCTEERALESERTLILNKS